MTNPPPAPPVAFRLKRPYATEDEFVVGEGHTVFRSGMVLIGAAPRPNGVIVRFEVALRDGASLIRGEGRVVAYRTAPEGSKPAGLEVKFSRLDPRGKAVVERVLRERHPPSSPSSGSIPDLGVSPSITPGPLSMPPPSGSIPPPIPSLEPPPSIEVPPSLEATAIEASPEEATQASLPPVAAMSEAAEAPAIAPRESEPPARPEAEGGDLTEQAPPARAMDVLAVARPSSEGGAAIDRLRGRAADGAWALVLEGVAREGLLERLRARPLSRG